MAGTKGRTRFNRLTAGRTKGSGMGGKKRGMQRKVRTHNRVGGR